MILEGDLPSGAKLTESTLAVISWVSRGGRCARRFACSRKPAWCEPRNRGVFVRDVPIEEAPRSSRCAAMDLYVGRKVAQSASAAQVRELRQLVDARPGRQGRCA